MDNSCATTGSGGLRVAHDMNYTLTHKLVCTLCVDTYTIIVTVVLRRVHTWVTSRPLGRVKSSNRWPQCARHQS